MSVTDEVDHGLSVPRREKTPPAPARWHPFEQVMPRMADKARAELLDELRRNGALEPVVFFADVVLDGRYRYEAARQLGVNYLRVDYTGTDPDGFFLSRNLARADLDERMREQINAKLSKLLHTAAGKTPAQLEPVAVMVLERSSTTWQEIEEEAPRPGRAPPTANAENTHLSPTTSRDPGPPLGANGDSHPSPPLRVQAVPLQDIRTSPHARPVAAETAHRLASSIAALGLLQPVVLQRLPGSAETFEVIAGLHRVTACRELGWRTVPATVVEVDPLHAELMLIDENLIRNELSPAERALATHRRKEIFETLHPETRHGGGTGGRAGRSKVEVANLATPNAVPAERFTSATADAIGRSERLVQRDAQRGNLLSRDELRRIARTSLDKGNAIDALLKMEPEARENLIVRAEKGEPVSLKAETSHGRQGARARPSADDRATGVADAESVPAHAPSPPHDRETWTAEGRSWFARGLPEWKTGLIEEPDILFSGEEWSRVARASRTA